MHASEIIANEPFAKELAVLKGVLWGLAIGIGYLFGGRVGLLAMIASVVGSEAFHVWHYRRRI